MPYSNVTPPALPEYESGLCSYNGVELPDINAVWTDKDTYPYALINVYNADHSYGLVLSQEACQRESGGDIMGNSAFRFYNLVDGAWEHYRTSSGLFLGVQAVTGSFVWSSYDVYNSADNGGDLAFSASEPAPTSDYPYRIIQFNYGLGEEDWYQLRFVVSAAPFKAAHTSLADGDGNVLISGMAAQNTGAIRGWVCGTDGAWEELDITEVSVVPGGVGNVYIRLWTSHDILDEEGNVWLAAGEVTPVEEIVSEAWRRSFKMGLALGLCGKPLPFVKRKLAAYLYNGVRLPDINTVWTDKEAYPYAHVFDTTSFDGCYKLFVASAQAVRDGTNVMTSGGTWILFKMSANLWEKQDTGSNAIISAQSMYPVKWANFDIQNTDGTVYLAASEPVPVYE